MEAENAAEVEHSQEEGQVQVALPKRNQYLVVLEPMPVAQLSRPPYSVVLEPMPAAQPLMLEPLTVAQLSGSSRSRELEPMPVAQLQSHPQLSL